VSRIEQRGRMSLRRPKPPIKGGSAPGEEEDEEEENPSGKKSHYVFVLEKQRHNRRCTVIGN